MMGKQTMRRGGCTQLPQVSEEAEELGEPLLLRDREEGAFAPWLLGGDQGKSATALLILRLGEDKAGKRMCTWLTAAQETWNGLEERESSLIGF